MKPKHHWHHTTWGRVICFIGSIKPAIPVLLAVAATMAYGTYLESKKTAAHAMDTVYASPWFIALMIWIGLALFFAVVTRWPWQRKHTGFIIVHAGLITTIIGGFISLFGRVEGTMVVQEGGTSDSIQTKGRQLIVREIPGTRPETVAQWDLDFILDSGSDQPLELEDGLKIRILDMWENSRSELTVLNDSATPLEAIELAFEPGATEGDWLPQSVADNPAARFFGIQFRVLPKGEAFEPVLATETGEDEDAEASEVLAADSAPSEVTTSDSTIDEQTSGSDSDDEAAVVEEDRVVFQMPDGSEIIVPDEGETVIDGWTVREFRMFTQAEVGQDGLKEAEVARDNPAAQVVLEHTDGSSERHIAFAKISDMVFAKPLSGESRSGLALFYIPAGTSDEPQMPPGHPEIDSSSSSNSDDDRSRLVFTNDDNEFKATWVKEDGSVQTFDLTGDPPWEIDLDGNTVYILNHYERARQGEEFEEVPIAKDPVPVLIAEVSEGYDSRTIQIPWRGQASMIREGAIRPTFFVFAPQTISVPFEVTLKDFRKTDYPGSDMAMAYESDVVFRPKPADTDIASGAPRRLDSREQTIWMNHPLEYDGWKIYQSGFQGDDISFFSIMKDPGLGITYLGCILVCGGILVMFYIPPFSRGHPGVPQIGTAVQSSPDAKGNGPA